MINEILLSYSWQESLLYYIIFTSVLCLLVIHKWRRRKMLKMLDGFHSKPTLPFIGNAHYITGNTKERITKGFKMVLDMELPAVGWIFHVPLVIVGTPNDIQVVLNKTSSGDLLTFFEKSFGNGILLCTGEQWRKSRRVISSAFPASMIPEYLKFFNKYSEIIMQKIASHANTNVALDVWEYVLRLNADIACQNISGFELESQENGCKWLIEAIEQAVELDSMRYTQPMLYFDFIYEIYLRLTRKQKVFEAIKSIPTTMIRNATEKLQRQQSKDVVGGPKTLLDILMEVHEVDPDFSEERVKDELLNMLLAGAATTARTTSFLLLMLAMHQDIQEKVYQEIKTIFGNGTRPVQMEDIEKLVYLEQCIKETLRKFPAVALTFRKHSEDIQLNHKQTIPANCHIVVFIYGLHHNERFYPNSKIWDPERFTPEAIRKRNKFAFLPFGLGGRSCIGAKYAMVAMKTQMVHWIRNYRFTTDMKMEEIQLGLDMALKCENGYWLKFWKRENNI